MNIKQIKFFSKTPLLVFSMVLAFSLFGAPMVSAQSPSPRVIMETTAGSIVIELDSVSAPKTVKNFLDYVDSGFYDDTIFHRVIRGFMIQGGGFDEHMRQKPTRPPIQNEADNGLKNHRGTIAMARTGDPHSATSQFFINTVDNSYLNYRSKTPQMWGYCVFGRVIDGMDTLKAVERMPTTVKGMHRNVPVTPVIIRKAFRIKPAAK